MNPNKGLIQMAKTEKDYTIKPKNDESTATMRHLYGRGNPADLRKAQLANTRPLRAFGQHQNISSDKRKR
jgi:hypothetical protein